MALDSYELCPGGHDKKIRFCCPDLVKELEQIETFLKAEQIAAGLSFLDQLEPKHPNRACLTAARLIMLRAENRFEEALPIARAFVEREPENAVAISELGHILVAQGSFQEALRLLIGGIEKGADNMISSALLGALFSLGLQMLAVGMVVPVVAIGNLLRSVGVSQQEAGQLLYRAMMIDEIPLMLRDARLERRCPTDFPAKTEFESALKLLDGGRWQKGLEAMEALTDRADRWPTLWRNIALVSLWLLDDAKAVEALDRYCVFSDENAEDLGDAMFLRLCLTSDPLGDMTHVFGREYTIEKFDEAREILLSTPTFYRIDVPVEQFVAENAAPPRDVFLLVDRPFAPEGTEPTLDTVSSQLATCLLFGKETDKPARLEVVEMLGDKQVAVDNLVRNAVGSTLGPVGEPIATRPISRTQALIQYRFRFKPENMPTAEQLEELVVAYYERFFLESFLESPLGLLDGKSPLAAAKDNLAEYKAKLLGAVTLLDNWMNPEIAVSVVGGILEKLGLPVPGPIAIPANLSRDAEAGFLESIPTWRWFRLDVGGMSTDMLLTALRTAGLIQEPRCLVRFSEEILSREPGSMPREARSLAYNSLIRVAQAEQNFEEALGWIDRAKAECEAARVSPGVWKVAAIGTYLAMGETAKAQETIQNVVSLHGNEPETMQVLQELFVGLGLMNPDGTLRGAPGSGRAAAPESSAGQTPKSGLWTPESENAGAGGSPSKLWTPD